MSSDALSLCQDLARTQGWVISRKEALGCGASPTLIDGMLRSKRWLALQRGVYCVSVDQPSRDTSLRAAVHRAGPDAALSHETAAELFGLMDERCPLIHITIPESRRVKPIAGLVLHRSVRLAEAIHPSLEPPRVRLEETVLDLVDRATSFDAALDMSCSACQRQLTTVARLVTTMSKRSKLRWRGVLTDTLDEIGSGVHSVLEYRYLHRVERPHGLPTALRQARIEAGGRSRYLDNLYRDYALCVELDGLQAHPDKQRWQDLKRVNAITEKGIMVLRYGWIDVDRWPCETAAQISAVLRHLGWRGRGRPCGPNCGAIRRA
ncbi:MAG TPA: hypothetical protein VGM14_05760 [Streptosporangiaceae bacterium]